MNKGSDKIKQIIENPALSEEEKQKRLSEVKEVANNPSVLLVSGRIVNRIRSSCRKCYALLANEVIAKNNVLNPDLLCSRCKKIYEYEKNKK